LTVINLDLPFTATYRTTASGREPKPRVGASTWSIP